MAPGSAEGAPTTAATAGGSLDAACSWRVRAAARREAAFSAAAALLDQAAHPEAEAPVTPLLRGDRAVDLRSQRFQLGDVGAPPVALVVERPLALVDLPLVVADVGEDARVVAVGAIEQHELLQHLTEVAGLERCLQGVRLGVLVRADDRDVERVSRVVQVRARRREAHRVLMDPRHRLLEAELRAVVLLDHALEANAVGLDLVPDLVRLGPRIADSIALGRGNHAYADAHRTEREHTGVTATPASPVEGPHVAARGEHQTDPSNSTAGRQRQVRPGRTTVRPAPAAVTNAAEPTPRPIRATP